MAQVSKDDLCMSFAAGTLQGPGETPVKLCRGAGLTRDIPVARDLLHKLGVNGADGPRRISVRRGRFYNKIIGHLSYA